MKMKVEGSADGGRFSGGDEEVRVCVRGGGELMMKKKRVSVGRCESEFLRVRT